MRKLLLVALILSSASALRVRGSFKPSETPYASIAKFGFQRTVSTADVDTRGYVFGNVTANSPLPMGVNLTLTLLPSGYYGKFAPTGGLLRTDESCARIFQEVGNLGFDTSCNPTGVEDFLRRVPCPPGRFCLDEDRPDLVVRENQLTYIVEDFQHPRFWFVTIVACYRDAACQWRFANISNNIEIKYDLWLVNGNPYKKHKNPLEYQFSFEKMDTAEMYLIFSAVYAVLTVVAWWNWNLVGRHLAHPACILFASIATLVVSLSSESLDVCLFAVDGVGLPPLSDVARIFRTFSQDLLVLLLVALASGWGLFYPDALNRRKLVIGTWLMYATVSMIITICKLAIGGESEADSDVIQGWPDVIALINRSVMAVMFMRELRSAFSRPERPTLSHFPSPKQRETLLRFGAAGLVWFLGVSLAEVIISTKVDTFWRFKIALGLTYGVDSVAHACLCHLLWAKRHTDSYGFGGTVPISTSPSPFFQDSKTAQSLDSNGFKSSSSVRRIGAALDGDESDVSDQCQRSLLRDDDDSDDGVELLDLTARR